MVALFEKSPTLPKLLEKEGYVSFQAGKWWEGNACRCGGFTEGMTHGDPAKGGRHGDDGLKIGRQGLQPVFDFLDAAKRDKKPFFVWYAPMMPHTPHNPPERLFDKYKDKTKSEFVAKYWAMCEWFDETVGDLLAKLEKNGQAENTVVIYLHDNGWIQDENSGAFAPEVETLAVRRRVAHADPGEVAGAREAGRVRPAREFGRSRAHRSCTRPARSPRRVMPGINLLDAHWVASRDAVFGEIFEHNAVDIAKPAANLQYRWVIDGTWKLIVPHEPNVKGGKIELYDLAKDASEKDNLAEKHPDKVKELTKKLDAWWKP